MPHPIAPHRRLIVALSVLAVALGVVLAALLHLAFQPQRQPVSDTVTPIAPMTEVTTDVAGASGAVAYLQTTNARCSGVLVDPEWVATVRHCVNTSAATGYPASIQVRFGAGESAANTPGALTRTGHAVLYRHSDLALVQLDRAVTDIAPVEMTDDATPNALVGWGFGPDAQRASPIITGDLHLKDGLEADHHLAVLSERHVIPGDSGGPILTDQGQLFGLISYSAEYKKWSLLDGHSSDYFAGIIGSTPAERDWITAVTVDRRLDDRTSLTPIVGADA